MGTLLKFPLRLIGTLLYSFLLLIVFIGNHFLALLMMLVVSLIAGLFGFSFELLAQAEGVMVLLGVVFLPVTMVLGVGVAIREMLCPFTANITQQLHNIAKPIPNI